MYADRDRAPKERGTDMRQQVVENCSVFIDSRYTDYTREFRKEMNALEYRGSVLQEGCGLRGLLAFIYRDSMRRNGQTIQNFPDRNSQTAFIG